MWANRRLSSCVSTISGTQPPKNLDTNMPALEVGERKDRVTAQFLRETSSYFHYLFMLRQMAQQRKAANQAR